MSNPHDLNNCVRARRAARGWSQQELADRAGIARASISAIEIERLIPSTTAALAIAAALDCRVEDLFQLSTQQQAVPTWAWPAAPNQPRYWQAEVGGRTLLYPYESSQLGNIQHDGVVAGGTLDLRVSVPPPTLVIACCDPGVTLLASELMRTAGIRLLAFNRPSRQALLLLKQGLVHVAGLHLSDAKKNGNNTAVKTELGSGYQLVRVAHWEEGVATANDRTSSLRSLVRSRLRWVGREPGSGAHQCLEELLGTRPAPRRIVRDHRGVAEAVRSGWADAGVCLRLAAEEANLKFLLVRREAYDLCFADQLDSDPRIRALLNVHQSSSFRQMVDDLPGYQSTGIGATVRVQ